MRPILFKKNTNGDATVGIPVILVSLVFIAVSQWIYTVQTPSHRLIGGRSVGTRTEVLRSLS